MVGYLALDLPTGSSYNEFINVTLNMSDLAFDAVAGIIMLRVDKDVELQLVNF